MCVTPNIKYEKIILWVWMWIWVGVLQNCDSGLGNCDSDDFKEISSDLRPAIDD